jgi:hypothetical protein
VGFNFQLSIISVAALRTFDKAGTLQRLYNAGIPKGYMGKGSMGEHVQLVLRLKHVERKRTFW